MVKIDLITGFLGAGKTTFIKKYVTYLVDKGLNIGILENDYGAVNVDMMLLSDIMGEHCHGEMVAGGCGADCHKRRFKTKLIAMGMSGYDRVIVEPSGIFDVDEFLDVLHEEPLDRWFEIGSIISIVESDIDKNMSKQSRFMLASQIANCGLLLMSKTQYILQSDIDSSVKYINDTLAEFQCSRIVKDEVITKDWGDFTDDDYEHFMHAGYKLHDYVKLWFDQGDIFNTVYIMNKAMSADELCPRVKSVFCDNNVGDVFRIKGFIKDEHGNWLELNATKSNVSICPIKEGQEIIIVIGAGLVEDRIKEYFDS